MMKSAIDWLMGKSESLSLNNDLNAVPANNGPEQEILHSEKDTSKENALCNGHFSEGTFSKSSSFSKPINEEMRSPWGRTLTPKSPKYISHISQKVSPSSRVSSPSGLSKRLTPASWDDMSFASDVMSPGFASRIAKEARGGRKLYDGSRKYPIGQEKYIRAGILPNVRLKGRSKPVVMSRRAPTSPLLPLASPSSPFSSSSLASGFLASATTRMPDISSVVSVLDSTPTSSASDSIKDPTSVQAVVAALEQAQSLKSGIKRSRYGDCKDSSKKQKCTLNSTLENINEFPTPVIVQAFNNGSGGGGEKMALDLSPPNSGENSLSSSHSSDRPQLSPENKRRCIPDPRIASYSSSKNIASPAFSLQSSGGRETPFSFYESHRDSDSESNKSLESHHSRQSDRSLRIQNHDPSGGRTSSSNQDNYDRSGSQTPQSLRGSYGIGGMSNGSSNSSRTATPSRPSHLFTMEAYKADKAKSHQRLNKMLGMLFNNVAEEEIESTSQLPLSSFNLVPATTSNSTAPAAAAIPVVPLLSSSPSDPPVAASSSVPSPAAVPSGLLKEAIAKVETNKSPAPAAEQKNVAKDDASCDSAGDGSAEVSASFTVILKPPTTDGASVLVKSSEETSESEDASLEKGSSQTASSSLQTSQTTTLQLPSYQDSIAPFSYGEIPNTLSTNTFSNRVPTAVLPSPNSSLNVSTSCASLLNASLSKEAKEGVPFMEERKTSSVASAVPTTTETTIAHSSSVPSPTFISGPISSIVPPSNPLEALKNTTYSISNSPLFNFGSGQSSSTSGHATVSETLFNFGKSPVTTITPTTTGNPLYSCMFSGPTVIATETVHLPKGSDVSSFQNKSEPAPRTENNNVSPSFSIFSPSSTSESNSKTTQPTTTSLSGLFTFSVPSPAAASSSTIKNTPSTVSEASQSLFTSPFTLGTNLPNSTSGTMAHTSTSSTPASNLFTFGATNLQTSAAISSSSDKMKSSVMPSETGNKLLSSASGFTFNPNQSGANPTTPSNVTTSTVSLFSNSNNSGSTHVYNFGSSSFKTLTQASVTSVVSTATTSGSTFTFGDPSKVVTQSKNTPFQFGAASSSASAAAILQTTPAISSIAGGGFSFNSTESGGVTAAATTTTTTSTVPQFGATTSSSGTTSNMFSFNMSGPPKQPSCFNFAPAAKTSTSTVNSNIFTFGGSNTAVQPSLFGTNLTVTSTAGGSFGGISAPKVSSATFSFGDGGSEKPSIPTFGRTQSVPPFGSPDTGNKSPAKPLFGGDTTAASPPLFGASSKTAALSPFGGTVEHNQNPFISAKSPVTAPPPAFGVFGTPKPGSNPVTAASGVASPSQNPFQIGQSANPNSTAFSFGQASQPTAPSQPGVFMFGSQGNASSAGTSTPAFGSGTFNFGNSNIAPGTTNIFTLGAASETLTAPRRPKVRAHHRRR